ncbi:MAG: SAM-dependent methyltransferase [Gammaproteobacteria bacterium]|jgi:SAM-dependent methyltransferase
MSNRPSTEELATATLSHYDINAQDYRTGTAEHDVSQNIDALLRAIEGEPPHTILDFGCGPGRDLVSLSKRGHRAKGLDGAAAVAELAREISGCEVWHQNFIDLDLPPRRFDGVFANASLFHIPREAVPKVLSALHESLKLRGVLFCSNPRGDNQEGFSGSRYGCYYDLSAWREIVTAAGFDEIEHYYRPPGLPRQQQPWLATVWRMRGN